MKKILALTVCMLMMLALACCAPAENNEEPSDDVQSETPADTGEEKKGDDANKVDLDIKDLKEVDAELLSASAEKLGFKNVLLFHAFANALGKNPDEVTQKDIDDVHYIAIGPETGGEYTMYVGHIDYVDLCLSEAATEETVLQQLNELVMMSEFDYKEENSLSDLGNFKNVEMFEIYDVVVDDVSFVANYDYLIFGYFKNNGITDVSSLADYNPESLMELDFTKNDIADWSYLEHIKEKVLVFYDINSGVSLYLDSYLEQKNNPAENAPSVNTDNGADNEEEQPILVDENGNPADFSSLFE